MEGQFYVYEYRHPVTKMPFYVGKGRNSRYKQHLNKSSKAMMAEIASIRDSELEPEVERVFFSNNENVVLSVEEHLITSYGLRKHGGLLVNELKKSGSNTRVVIPEDVVSLLGTMPDVELAEKTGFNWSTLRDYRRANNIKSFREATKGTSEFGNRFKNDTNTYTLYDTNGNKVSGDRYCILDVTGIDTCSLGDLLKGNRKHILGWFLEKPSEFTITKYSVRDLMNDTGETFQGTYHEMSECLGFRMQSCRNLFTGKSGSLYGWRLVKGGSE